MKIALDTNVILYGAGLERVAADKPKIVMARGLTAHLPRANEMFVSAQVLGESFNVLVKRLHYDRAEAAAFAKDWAAATEIGDTTSALMGEAMDLAARHQLQIWDAVVMAVSADAGCSLLLSEDMQDGFVWRGMTVVNPFAARLDPRLASLLAE